MCRYNLSIANKSIADEYHYSYSQMSDILTAWSLAYAFGQIINGLITDRIGGKKAMLIGAAGTIVMNVLFGAASVWGMLGVFMAIRGIDGYVQSFGARGMTKIKTAWFVKTERGGFAGIFGFMINLGRLGIFTFGPALLAGFTIFGMLQVGAALEVAVLGAVDRDRDRRGCDVAGRERNTRRKRLPARRGIRRPPTG